MSAVEVTKIDRRPSGARVEFRTVHRKYQAIVMPHGEITRLDVAVEMPGGRWWRCDRFRWGIPRRVQTAVLQALQH
jgi:hypothetical protein